MRPAAAVQATKPKGTVSPSGFAHEAAADNVA